MNTSNDRLEPEALQSLRGRSWPNGDAGLTRVEQRLLTAHAQARNGVASRVLAFVSRHRVLTASISVAALAGSVLAGTYMFNRLYSITISDDQGNVLTAPRVLVAPGQEASISIGSVDDPDNNITVTIDGDGNVSTNRNDVNVDVEVQEVESNTTRPK